VPQQVCRDALRAQTLDDFTDSDCGLVARLLCYHTVDVKPTKLSQTIRPTQPGHFRSRRLPDSASLPPKCATCNGSGCHIQHDHKPPTKWMRLAAKVGVRKLTLCEKCPNCSGTGKDLHFETVAERFGVRQRDVTAWACLEPRTINIPMGKGIIKDKLMLADDGRPRTVPDPALLTPAHMFNYAKDKCKSVAAEHTQRAEPKDPIDVKVDRILERCKTLHEIPSMERTLDFKNSQEVGHYEMWRKRVHYKEWLKHKTSDDSSLTSSEQLHTAESDQAHTAAFEAIKDDLVLELTPAFGDVKDDTAAKEQELLERLKKERIQRLANAPLPKIMYSGKPLKEKERKPMKAANVTM